MRFLLFFRLRVCVVDTFKSIFEYFFPFISPPLISSVPPVCVLFFRSNVVRTRRGTTEAVWLLTNKCCVAAHLFGPQHGYCLRAIGRLCRNDVREVGRPAREALRRCSHTALFIIASLFVLHSLQGLQEPWKTFSRTARNPDKCK